MTTAKPRRGTALEEGLHSAFPTPLLVKRYRDSELNEKLLALVADREAREKTTGMSNVGGWHSPPDFLDAQDPTIFELRQRVFACVKKMLYLTKHVALGVEHTIRLSAWANVARDGAYNAVHNHNPAVFSGVYYVDLGDPAPEGSRDGLIEFIDPRPGPHGGPLPTHALHAPLIVDPEPGMLLMFPGWLLHYVHPYRGKSPRVSIAFNLWMSAETRPPS